MGITMYLHNEMPLFSRLIEDTSIASGIDENYVYKDYFVCMALKEIVKANPSFVFKGGTAMSKCYQVIARFSEDVDLGLDHKKPTEGMRRKTKEAVKTALENLGLTIDSLDTTRSRREFNQYRVSLPLMSKNAPSDILIIETGLMTPTSPSQHGTVMSFIGVHLENIGRQDLIEQFELERFDVNVVSLERTFADKIFAIADYYLNGDIPDRQSRHIYDLYKLEKVIEFDEGLVALMKQVRSERESNHKCTSASPDVCLPKILKELYDKQIYRHDYKTITMPLLYDDVDYDTAISALLEIVSFLNENPLVGK